MASSVDDSSDYDSSFRGYGGSNLAIQDQHRTEGGSGIEGDQTEDLFLNIAQDPPQKEDAEEGITRVERRRVSLLVQIDAVSLFRVGDGDTNCSTLHPYLIASYLCLLHSVCLLEYMEDHHAEDPSLEK